MTIFAKIIAGEIPCHRVYEDEHVFAFLDIAPLSPGHTLVIPKDAVATMGELSDDAAAALVRSTSIVALTSSTADASFSAVFLSTTPRALSTSSWMASAASESLRCAAIFSSSLACAAATACCACSLRSAAWRGKYQSATALKPTATAKMAAPISC